MIEVNAKVPYFRLSQEIYLLYTGKSTLLKIMAGVDKEYDGTARPLPGASIGYLPQEPQLTHETVQECIDEAVQLRRPKLCPPALPGSSLLRLCYVNTTGR